MLLPNFTARAYASVLQQIEGSLPTMPPAAPQPPEPDLHALADQIRAKMGDVVSVSVERYCAGHGESREHIVVMPA